MKRIISLILVAVLALSLCACGGGGGANQGITKTPHDQITHVLEGKEETTYHDFVDGKCTRCAETTIFRQDPMYKSPEILLTAQAKQGTIEHFWYPTEAYTVERKYAAQTGDNSYQGKLRIMKRAFVYLPYGYDANRAEPYNVLFMMHGDKLNEGYWFANGFYKPTDSNFTNGYGTNNVLDYMYMNEDIEDTIFVAITMYEYYGGTQHENWEQGEAVLTGNDTEQDNAYSGFIDPNYPVCEDFPWYMKKGLDYEGADEYYWMEFANALYPYVIEHYNVYAKEATDEAMKAARDHVGFTGLSRGGASVNSVATNCLEYISYFAYESNAWRITAADSIFNGLIENFKAKEKDYPVNFIFMSDGTEENAVLHDTIMLKVRDAMGWQEGCDIAAGDKICYTVVNGTAHNYATWITCLYNLMHVFFKK